MKPKAILDDPFLEGIDGPSPEEVPLPPPGLYPEGGGREPFIASEVALAELRVWASSRPPSTAERAKTLIAELEALRFEAFDRFELGEAKMADYVKACAEVVARAAAFRRPSSSQ